jgi:hypothetical protein
VVFHTPKRGKLIPEDIPDPCKLVKNNGNSKCAENI